MLEAEKSYSNGNLSVTKALELLSFFTPKKNIWGTRELAAASGYGPSTVFKLLLPFVEAGFLEQSSETKQYRLGVQFIRYANMVENQLDLVAQSQKVMEKLVEQEKGTVNISVYAGMHVYHKLAVSYEDEIQITPRHYESNILPLTATGRLLLSTLSKDELQKYLEEYGKTEGLYQKTEELDSFWEELCLCRQRGYAFAYFNRFPEIYSVAVPIYNSYKKLVAAVSYYETVCENLDERIDWLAACLKQAASQIMKNMGWDTSPL